MASIDLWSIGGEGQISLSWNLFGVVVFQRSMLNWGDQSALGICALFYMWNLVGVVVCHRSMADWRRGWGQSVMKLIQCSGLPEIYSPLEEGVGSVCDWNLFGVVVFQRSMLTWGGQSALGICALFYMWNLVSVVVFHRSMVDWRRGWGQSVMKLIQCSGLPEIYAGLWGGG